MFYPLAAIDITLYCLMPHLLTDHFLQLIHSLFVLSKIFLFCPLSKPIASHQHWIWVFVKQNHQDLLAFKGAVIELMPNFLYDFIQRRVIEIVDSSMVQLLDCFDGCPYTVVLISWSKTCRLRGRLAWCLHLLLRRWGIKASLIVAPVCIHRIKVIHHFNLIIFYTNILLH